MRTRTGILWTTIVIGYLLHYTEVQGDEEPATATVLPPTSTSPSSATTVPSSTASEAKVTDPAVAATTVTATTITSVTVPTTSQPIITAPATTVPTTSVPTTTVATTNVTATLVTATNVSTSVPTHADSTTTDSKPTAESPPTKESAPTPANTAPAELTSVGSTTTKHEDSGHMDPTSVSAAPAGPTSSNSVLGHSATSGSPSVGPKPSEQASTSKPTSLSASTPVGTKPSPASTQPSPVPTSQDQLSSSQGPIRTTVSQPEATKPIIIERIEETITQEHMQDPKYKEETNVQICQMLLKKLSVTGNCSLSGKKVNDKYSFNSVSLEVDPSAAQKIYHEISAEQPSVPLTLIAILSSCGALVLILVFFALYCMYHHRSYRKNQQHLTEELQTVENGYHDNPTLEVMEVQPEMQEKKVALNGEFNDSWIVPFDNLAKEDIPDEEDTHL